MKTYQQSDNQYLNVGKIVNTQGIKGEVRVIAITDFGEERFQKGNELFLFLPRQKEPLTLTIENHRRHKNFDILKFVGYDNINDVEAFRDGILKVSRDNLVDLEEGEFYYFQIIGLPVYDQEKGYIGKVSEILTPGANDVWVVETEDDKEVLLPYIDEVILKVDIDGKRIDVDIPEGLM